MSAAIVVAAIRVSGGFVGEQVQLAPFSVVRALVDQETCHETLNRKHCHGGPRALGRGWRVGANGGGRLGNGHSRRDGSGRPVGASIDHGGPRRRRGRGRIETAQSLTLLHAGAGCDGDLLETPLGYRQGWPGNCALPCTGADCEQWVVDGTCRAGLGRELHVARGLQVKAG